MRQRKEIIFKFKIVDKRFVAKKKIIFFDGDGTLWYPKKTKWKVKPHHIYTSIDMKPKEYLKQLILTPQILKILKYFKKKEVVLVVLSTHPHKKIEADMHLRNKVIHFGLDKIFDAVYSARPFPWGKGKIVESVLKKLKIPKSRALLIGDSYTYDYMSARKVGVDCVLLSTPYLSIARGRKVGMVIEKWKELVV
jgi:FMN phosphatase YigB (HAD superfamily)